MQIWAAEVDLWWAAVELGKLLACTAIVAGTIEGLAFVWEHIEELARDERDC